MTTIECREYAATNAAAQILISLSSPLIAIKRIRDLSTGRRPAAVKVARSNEVVSQCSVPLRQDISVCTGRLLLRAFRVVEGVCASLTAQRSARPCCGKYEISEFFCPTCRCLYVAALVRRRDGRSSSQIFSSNLRWLLLLMFACFYAASQCAANKSRFPTVCMSGMIRLGRYSTTEPRDTGLDSLFGGGAGYITTGAERGYTHLLRHIAEGCTQPDRVESTRRWRIKQAYQQGESVTRCTCMGDYLSGTGKSLDKLVFLRAPLLHSPHLTTWRVLGRMPKQRESRAMEIRCLRRYTLLPAAPFVRTSGNVAPLNMRPRFRLECGTALEGPTCIRVLQKLFVDRKNASSTGAAAVLGCQLGRERLDRSTFHHVRIGFSFFCSSLVSLTERSEPFIPHFSPKSRAANPTYNNGNISMFSSRTRDFPFVRESGNATSEIRGKEKEVLGSSEFLRGVDATWNVCVDSDWKNYSREQLLPDIDKPPRADENKKKVLMNGALYNVQRFPADTLASTPSSGRLHTEQMRSRDAYLERVAADKAAVGGDEAEAGKGELKRKQPRKLTWRDYLSWLPPPQPPLNSVQRTAHRETSHKSKTSGDAGDEARFSVVGSSTKEEDSYNEWEGFPPSASTKIDDLPLESLMWGNETLLYRQAFKDAPMIIDDETFRRQESRWLDAEELKRVQREEKSVYGIPEDVPDDCWIPISPHLPEGRLVHEYGLVPNITLTEAGYDYIETYHDPARNYTWAYKRWNPLKQEGKPPRDLEGEAQSIYELETEKSRRYWHQEAHPPFLQPDDGVFRQATIADEMIKGIKRTPLGMDQWHYTPSHPLGQAAELQSFWLTAVKRTLREAKARGAGEAAAAAAVAAARESSSLSKNTLRRASSDSTSERVVQTSLPLWDCQPSAEDHAATSSLFHIRRAAQGAGVVDSSSACHCQPGAKVQSHVKGSVHAGAAECGSLHGDEAVSGLSACGKQQVHQFHAIDGSPTKGHTAGGRNTLSSAAVEEISTRTGDSFTNWERARGTTNRAKSSVPGPLVSHGYTERTFRARRSAYQPFAFTNAEEGGAGATEFADDMKYRQLGKSELFVSEVGLGTMTAGSPQLDEVSTKELLSYAVDAWGVNFIDTAELYPLPAAPHTYGRAEEIIGGWLGSTGRRRGCRREELVIATKVAGPSSKLAWLRSACDSYMNHPEKNHSEAYHQPSGAAEQLHSDKLFVVSEGERATEDARRTSNNSCRAFSHPYTGTSLSKAQIIQAAEGSIRRLQTDYIDLFQLHWPDRYVPMQNSGDAAEVLYDPQAARVQEATRDVIAMEEQLEAIKELLHQGKIRAWGLSNETPYGVCRFTRLAVKAGLPPPASVQLQYNLLCRNDVEKGFVELARPQNAGTGLLAYGALAGGILTGKYLEWLEKPTTGRLLRFPSYMRRYRGSLAARAVTSYYYLALRLGHPNLTVMALRWVLTRPFICSTLLGFTDYYQLRENLCCTHAVCGVISDWTEREINFLHWKWRDTLRIIQ